MNIAFLAHDNKKILMENLCIAYRYILSKHKLFATGTTGRLIEDNINLPVSKYLAGRLGGEEQLGVQIAHNDIDLVIFLVDPTSTNPDEMASKNIMRLCDIHNIPLASNLATAEALLLALDRGDLNWREITK